MYRNVLVMLLAPILVPAALALGVRVFEIVPVVVIQSIEGETIRVEAQFNPKEISIDKPVPWQKHKNVEGDAPTLEFTAAEPKTLSAELLFDLSEDKGDVYATYIRKLERLAMIDPTLNVPRWSCSVGETGSRHSKGLWRS